MFTHGAEGDIERPNGEEDTPMHSALCYKGYMHVAQCLYDNGARHSKKSMYCFENNKLNVVQWLFNTGGSQDVTRPHKRNVESHLKKLH